MEEVGWGGEGGGGGGMIGGRDGGATDYVWTLDEGGELRREQG